MQKKIFFLSVLWCLVSVKLIAQEIKQGENTSLKDFSSLVATFQDYMSAHPQEKIHVHFDKPYYSVGDTVWFKVYLVNALGHRLSAISKLVYLDIQSPGGELRHLVLPVISGMASGQLNLADSLYRDGNYSLRAYTQWMRNAGPDYFFNYTLRIGDVLHYKANVAAAFDKKPEGGFTALLNYRHANGAALVGQEFSYQLKKENKVILAGKAVTDSAGKAGIVFPPNKDANDEQLVLETATTLNSGANLTKEFVVSTAKGVLALDFFPEGGSLVQHIRSRVGFKAVNQHGLGVPVKGYIENEKGEQVSLFESLHGGMGTFAFMPQQGHNYRAVITEGVNKGLSFALPAALNEGYVLSVNPKANDSLQVRISRSEGMFSEQQVALLIQANGEVLKAIKLPISGRSIAFALPKSSLSEGINQFTLFSANNKPLAERLVFMQKQALQSTLNSDKDKYDTRSRVKLSFLLTDEKGKGIVGGYSAAVVKAGKVSLPEEKQLSIYANLLLSSDLQGYIEDPNYYFTGNNPQKAAELDALLLTQGWRRFKWDDVLSGKSTPPAFKAEESLAINGTVTTLGGKPVAGATINLLAPKALLFLDTIADARGRFSFNNLELSDSVDVMIRARGAKERNQVKITLDNVAELPPMKLIHQSSSTLAVTDTAMQAYLSQTSALFDQMESTGRITQGTTLKTVEIIGKNKTPEIKGSVYPFAASPPDYTFEPDKLQNMVNLQTHLKGLMGVIVNGDKIYGRYKGKIGPMVILLNGSPIDDLSGINPKALIGVQIIKGGIIALNMALGLGLLDNPTLAEDSGTCFGIVFLTMGKIPDKFIKANRPTGFLQLALAGYTYSREFYAPRYDQPDNTRPNTDRRSTLFWKPGIITNEDGSGEFDFYTSDETGQYQVILEGIGSNGQLCRMVSYFVVE